MSFSPRWSVCAVLALMSLLPLSARAQDRGLAGQWEDFNHYVLIARPDLAAGQAQALLSADAQQLLDVIEAGAYKDIRFVIERAQKFESLAPSAKQLGQMIDAALLSRMRDPGRIESAIGRLGEGERARLNATRQLREAGQFAAPQLLAVLRDDNRSALHPQVQAAMVAIGQPLVDPLSVALPQLEPVQQRQVARILAEIGYPRALPALQQVIDHPKTDPAAREVAVAAFDQLAAAAGAEAGKGPAARLYLHLAQRLYDAATEQRAIPGFDPGTGKGIVWTYGPRVGLVAVPVPGPIYGDVLAMRNAAQALRLDPTLDSALTVYLAANCRRENRLPAGQTDPSYASVLQPPTFYLRTAGPARQQEVLARALAAGDAELALDAIAALADTGGTAALISEGAASQPLLTALTFSDRRVRWDAAAALTNARPAEPFPGSHQVVRVLAEAVRQSDKQYALVVTADATEANSLSDLARQMGYTVSAGTGLGEMANLIAATPGIDLILVGGSADAYESVLNQARLDYKLAGAPLVAVVDPATQADLGRRFERVALAVPVLKGDAAVLRSSVQKVIADQAGPAISPEAAQAYAIRSLGLLADVGACSKVYKVADAEPTLIEALGDVRIPVVQGSGAVLAVIDSASAQNAIFDAALDARRPQEVRVSLLASLAVSATQHGNQADEARMTKLLELVKASTGELALAASRAIGALAPPTASLVEMVKQ